MSMIADRKRGVRAVSMSTTSGSVSAPTPAKKVATPMENAKTPKKRFVRAMSSKSAPTPAKTKKRR
jgi:hypothetical protein